VISDEQISKHIPALPHGIRILQLIYPNSMAKELRKMCQINVKSLQHVSEFL